ncbi:MAG: phosphatase PAP2 family protein [Thermoflavifilum sp.]|uniref:phosphatase PAP2 family protein n=1 Tax=Thermoflavifilum sp. TaxID=1968839 RepID=UPI0018A3BA26|nr:phosphatase PAP2 family protein [Thermoflavifilum sp.]QOR76410.1 MAG: phosphatase PAP2 family protein [Thermoflavifilum sp.]
MNLYPLMLLSHIFISHVIQEWDVHLLEKLNIHHAPIWDAAMNVITYTAAYITIAIPLICLIVAFTQKDAFLRIKAWFLISCLVTASLLASGIKQAVQRPRPWHSYQMIEKKTEGGGWSFPSGHTTGAFALAFAMGVAFRKKKWMLPVMVGWACVVGYSRMDLGVHYPSDVLGGMLTAAATVALNYLFFKKGFQRYRELWSYPYDTAKSDIQDSQS